MSNRKQTKKALFSSVISLILCFSMLIGTTFAWFTDSVQSGLNEIRAGNLDVELYHTNSKTSGEVKGDTKLFTDVTLWEPGAAAYEILTVKNAGTLALKYAMSLNWNKETENNLNGHKLSDILKVAVIEDYEGLDLTDREAVVAAAEAATNGDLKTFADSDVLYPAENADGYATEKTACVVIYWVPGETDNNYNANNGQQTSDGKPLHIDLGVIVEATQLVYEEDSFGDDYDAKAEYPDNQWLGDAATELSYNEETGVYEIWTPADLAYFAQVVNGTTGLQTYAVESKGYTFQGETVKLMANIDLNDLPWTPIGNAAAWFSGTFDGNGYTIANLNVSGEDCVGLFGNAYPSAVIKNLTINGASVTGNHWVGGVVGYIYGSVEGCTVVNADIDCVPVLKDGIYYDGDKAGAIAGYVGEGSYVIKNCDVINTSVSAYRDLGGVAGMAQSGVTVSGADLQNVSVDYVSAAPYEDGDPNQNKGLVVGRGDAKVSSSYVEVTTAEELKAVVNGGVGAKIPEGVDITLDVAEGETLSGSNGTLIYSQGNLTLTGSGTIKSTAASYAIRVQSGSLTIDSADINLEGAFGCISVFNGAEVTINGGTYSNTGVAGMTSHVVYLGGYGTININGGSFTRGAGGDSGGVIVGYGWSNAANEKAVININGGTINSETAWGWISNYDGTWTEINAMGGTFGRDPSKFVAEGYKATKLDNGMYLVAAEDAVVTNDLTSVNEAVSAGGEVVLTGDLPGEASSSSGYGATAVTVNAGGVLDGNGYTISAPDASGTWDSVISCKGGTIKNVTVTEGFRGIFIAYPTSDIVIDNVVIDYTCYTMNADDGGNVNLTVTNSTLNGWTSYTSNFASVSFTNCNFGQGNGGYAYAYCRPYCSTTMTGCNFEAGYLVDVAGGTLTLVDCYLDGVLITAENVSELLDEPDVDLANVVVINN